MNHNCSCGGRLVSLDENPIYFRKKCDRCGKIQKQHKRRSTKKDK